MKFQKLKVWKSKNFQMFKQLIWPLEDLKHHFLLRNPDMVIPSIFLSLANLHLPDRGLLFSLPFMLMLCEKNCLMDGFLATAGSSSGSISSNSTLTPFSSKMVSAVFQLKRTIDGKPKKESKLSRRNFLVTASPGYPEPHSLVISKPSCFSTNIQSRKHLSLATLAQMDAADTPETIITSHSRIKKSLENWFYNFFRVIALVT